MEIRKSACLSIKRTVQVLEEDSREIIRVLCINDNLTSVLDYPMH